MTLPLDPELRVPLGIFGVGLLIAVGFLWRERSAFKRPTGK